MKVAQAVALGLVQGPAELLPVSSSGHLVLLGWRDDELDGELRKAFQVALHAGTALGLLPLVRRELQEDVLAAAVTVGPAALAGALFERPIEERLGSPRSVAVAQLVAGLALAAADIAPAVRRRNDARLLDHLLIGCAQASALVPGVSRGGASLTAARLLRFERRAASALSRRAALPVIAGAAVLKGARLARRGLPARLRGPFVAGMAAAYASTMASRRLIDAIDRAPSYLPFAAYRVMLGVVALRGSCARHTASAGRPPASA